MTGVVIVGVDGSETAMRAAQAAQQLAIGLGASLRVVSAFDSNRTEVVEIGTDKWIVSDAAEAEKVARDVAARLKDERLEVTYSAARGKPGEALVKEAEMQDATLIVVGNRRMQGLGRVLGSVANTVAHTAPCDVYIAKTDQA
ncbi:universal stress protein [Paenarthrobacter ilicis]|uniref:Nucleotide-binding universal stress UspA family protein n=1 Tax=Paenarthrobacter ilicis TaxID=43665 RepID=A0ABX0TNX2_9MICC|nr:universal stress protein [Paenarthrobacter ilicis]MBM7794796.1 nucleotide-binding universal stress UspA family protein [Paenarthrobacter ilicis]NIJ02905.1 nucleotide-binding universal stress UspA family protein [Paenarthrobacter ilicis]